MLPAAPGRLRFRDFDGTDEALALMTEALEGTRTRTRARTSPRARREVPAERLHGELVRCPSPRDRWRVATLPGGEPVGFAFPARNDDKLRRLPQQTPRPQIRSDAIRRISADDATRLPHLCPLDTLSPDRNPCRS